MQAINVDLLIDMLKKRFPKFDEDGSWFYDSQYYAYSREDVIDAYNAWKEFYEKEHLKYLPEAFDCDDFADQFRAIARMTLLRKYKIYAGSIAPAVAIGELYYRGEFLGYHAWNLVLANVFMDYNLILEFEPQTLTFFWYSTPDGFRYELRWVVW